MASWPRAIEGDGVEPRVIDEGLDEDLEYARPPELVAWGTVDGVPWRIQASVTKPGPDAKWWEHGPVGPELLFMLGRDDAFGGGGAGTYLNEGTHMTASIHFFGSQPAIVSWTGVVSDGVARVVVAPDDEDEVEIEIRDGPPGFLRIFWFFPPRGVEGTVVAYAADGTVLQSERLMDVEVSPDSNSGTSVNGFGYRADRPPPGWPPDDTEYGPGEGPRHAEDFHLHELTFPIYAVPPSRWDGYAGLSGSSSSGSDVTGVRLGYFDEPGGSVRGFEIVNRRPGRRRGERRFGRDDVGIWWSAPFEDSDVINFVPRFLPDEERRAIFGGAGSWILGPMRVAGVIEVELLGRRVETQRRELKRFPAYRSIHFELPEVQLLVQGWGLSFDELEVFTRTLEPLELGNELFRALKGAEAQSKRRFHEIHGHHHGEP